MFGSEAGDSNRPADRPRHDHCNAHDSLLSPIVFGHLKICLIGLLAEDLLHQGDELGAKISVLVDIGVPPLGHADIAKYCRQT